MVPVPENTPEALLLGSGGVMSTNLEEKLQRYLFVGTTPELTEAMLRDFLGRARY